MREVAVTQMKNNTKEGEQVLTYGELLVWIEICFIVSTIKGFQYHVFWSRHTIDTSNTAHYHLNYILTWTRFEEILKALIIPNEKPPA